MSSADPATKPVPLPVTLLAAAAASPILAAVQGGTRLVIHSVNSSVDGNTDSASFAEAFPSHSEPVRSVALTADGTLMASCGDDKSVRLWRIATDGDFAVKVEVVGEIVHKKKLAAVAFSPLQMVPVSDKAESWVPRTDDTSPTLIFADKFGDVFGISVATMIEHGVEGAAEIAAAAPGGRHRHVPGDAQLLLGHIASITAMTVVGQGKFILTADKDEKIRTTQFPKSFNIEAFCLGHTEFACALAEVPSEPGSSLCVSGGLDGTIRLWDYQSGELLQTELALPNVDHPEKCVVSHVTASAKHVAACVEGHSDILVFTVTQDTPYQLRREQVSTVFVERVRSVSFLFDGTLLVASRTPDGLVHTLRRGNDGVWNSIRSTSVTGSQFQRAFSREGTVDEVTKLDSTLSCENMRKHILPERPSKRPRSDADAGKAGDEE